MKKLNQFFPVLKLQKFCDIRVFPKLSLNSMNSMKLKFGDVTTRGSPTCCDCHYVKKIIFSLDYYFLSMFSIFVVLFNTVCHLLMSCRNFSLFIRVPCILLYGDLLALKTHHYKPNPMNSLNYVKELWKNLNVLCQWWHSFVQSTLRFSRSHFQHSFLL